MGVGASGRHAKRPGNDPRAPRAPVAYRTPRGVSTTGSTCGGCGRDQLLGLQAERPELLAERVPVDPEESGGAKLVAPGLAEHRAEERALDEPQHEVVEVRRLPRPEPPHALGELLL